MSALINQGNKKMGDSCESPIRKTLMIKVVIWLPQAEICQSPPPRSKLA